MSFVLRVILLAAALVFAASLAVAALVLLLLWSLRALWARLTGRPVTPFVVRMDPRGGFGRVWRPQQSTPDPAAERPSRARIEDVTDVEPK